MLNEPILGFIHVSQFLDKGTSGLVYQGIIYDVINILSFQLL